MKWQSADGITWCDVTLNLYWGCTRIEGDPACGPDNSFRPGSFVRVALDSSQVVYRITEIGPGNILSAKATCAQVLCPDQISLIPMLNLVPVGAICYAETWAERCGYNDKPAAEGKTKTLFPIWGAGEKRRFFGDRPIQDVALISRAWSKEGTPERNCRVFIMSMGDWAEGRPDQAEAREKLWPALAAAGNIDALMLTKRTGLISKLCPFSTGANQWPDPDIRRRVWQMTTVVTKKWADIRIPQLLDAVHDDQVAGLSIEPAVEPFDLPQKFLDRGKRAWVIYGGQSGHNVIPMDPAWARRTLAQCREASVPFHLKQLSGSTKAELQNIPEDLRIREFPTSGC